MDLAPTAESQTPADRGFFRRAPPRAFRLLQRDRNFENYQDLEASYHTRPSAWVEPVGKWGRGSVRLMEIPTRSEFDDNIGAFWVPDTLPRRLNRSRSNTACTGRSIPSLRLRASCVRPGMGKPPTTIPGWSGSWSISTGRNCRR